MTRLLRPGTSKLRVPLMSNFLTLSNSVIAKVDLGRMDGWKGIGRGEGRELSVFSATLRGALRHRGIRFVLTQSRPCVCTCSRWNLSRGVVSRFPVFSGLVAGTTFFFISASCLAALLLPMVYSTGPSPRPEDRSPARSEFSPKRGSKSPGPPKPRSRVRYEDEERKLRRQRQYTAGSAGPSRSRSSKSSRRSLVGSPQHPSADDRHLMSVLVQQRRSAAGWRTCRLWKYITSEERFTKAVRAGLGGRMNPLLRVREWFLQTFELCFLQRFL